jgi:protein TonB
MAPHAVLGQMLPGRYPRWGYLDRLEVNEHMPGACAAILALTGVTLMLAVVLQRVSSTAEHVEGSVLRPPQEVYFLPPSIVPRPVARPPQRPGVPVEKRTAPQVRPVDDATAPEDPAVGPWGGAPAGARGGIGETVWEESHIAGDFPLEPPAPQPGPEAFVAVEHQPELVWMQEPAYPEFARDAGIEGQVLLRVLVGADGAMQRVVLLQGVLGLDEAAIEAAATAVFRPALQQGRPVPVWVVMPIEFNLRRPVR